MGRSKDPILSVRLPHDLEDRLTKCATALDLSKNDIARHAIRAAVVEIERNGGKIVIPPTMELHVVPEVRDPLAPDRPQKFIPAPGAVFAPSVNEDPPPRPDSTPKEPRPTRARRALRDMQQRETKNRSKSK